MPKIEAGRLIRERFRVPEEVRSLRRHRHRPTKKCIQEEALNMAMGRWEGAMTHKAALSLHAPTLRITRCRRFYNQAVGTLDTI